MSHDRFSTILVGIAKDPTAWFSSVTTLLANAIVLPTSFLPATLEGWLAVTLSGASIIYITSRIFFLWRKTNKSDED